MRVAIGSSFGVACSANDTARATSRVLDMASAPSSSELSSRPGLSADEKWARALRKKLRNCAELEKKRSDGAVLDEEQAKALERRAALEAQLASLAPRGHAHPGVIAHSGRGGLSASTSATDGIAHAGVDGRPNSRKTGKGSGPKGQLRVIRKAKSVARSFSAKKRLKGKGKKKKCAARGG